MITQTKAKGSKHYCMRQTGLNQYITIPNLIEGDMFSLKSLFKGDNLIRNDGRVTMIACNALP